MNNSCSLLVYRWPQPETIHRPHIWNSIGSWGWENGTEEIPTANGIVPRNVARNNVRKYMWHVVQALKSASFCVYVWAQRATKCRENSIHRVHCTHVNDPTYYRTQPNCIFMPLNISLTERAKCKTSYFRFSWVGTIPFEFGYCYAQWCRSIAASKYAWIICSTEYCIIWASSTLPSILRFLWLWYATITGCSIWMHTKWDSNPMLHFECNFILILFIWNSIQTGIVVQSVKVSSRSALHFRCADSFDKIMEYRWKLSWINLDSLWFCPFIVH